MKEMSCLSGQPDRAGAAQVVKHRDLIYNVTSYRYTVMMIYV